MSISIVSGRETERQSLSVSLPLIPHCLSVSLPLIMRVCVREGKDIENEAHSLPEGDGFEVKVQSRELYLSVLIREFSAKKIPS